ncbi:MAG: FAD-dependent oxidoreductase [Christensenellales bacterium]
MYDLIVVGGGLTGCAAAVAGARRGLKALLIERAGALGGAAVNNLVNPFMPNATKIDGTYTELSQGMYAEMKARLDAMGARRGGTFHEEYLKIMLDRFTSEAGVAVLFHTSLVDADCADGRIARVRVVNKAGSQTYEARYFIDCTGDADLAVRCGCPHRIGRAQDGLCQPMTLCFRVSNVDSERYQAVRETISPRYQEAQRAGKIKNPREDVLIFPTMIGGTLHFNSTRVVKLNPVDPFDLSRAEREAREQAFELFAFLKENIEGFERADFAYSAAQIGVRESRMINGRHLLTAEELKDCVRFEDAIAAGNYDIDIHNPEGSGTSHYYFPEGQYYTIPYRALLPQGVDNLLVAGRCISTTHEAQASIRIMPICITLGEAAGAAVAVASLADAACQDADVRAIQQTLRESGAFLGI